MLLCLLITFYLLISWVLKIILKIILQRFPL